MHQSVLLFEAHHECEVGSANAVFCQQLGLMYSLSTEASWLCAGSPARAPAASPTHCTSPTKSAPQHTPSPQQQACSHTAWSEPTQNMAQLMSSLDDLQAHLRQWRAKPPADPITPVATPMSMTRQNSSLCHSDANSTASTRLHAAGCTRENKAQQSQPYAILHSTRAASGQQAAQLHEFRRRVSPPAKQQQQQSQARTVAGASRSKKASYAGQQRRHTSSARCAHDSHLVASNTSSPAQEVLDGVGCSPASAGTFAVGNCAHEKWLPSTPTSCTSSLDRLTSESISLGAHSRMFSLALPACLLSTEQKGGHKETEICPPQQCTTSLCTPSAVAQSQQQGSGMGCMMSPISPGSPPISAQQLPTTRAVHPALVHRDGMPAHCEALLKSSTTSSADKLAGPGKGLHLSPQALQYLPFASPDRSPQAKRHWVLPSRLGASVDTVRTCTPEPAQAPSHSGPQSLLAPGTLWEAASDHQAVILSPTSEATCSVHGCLPLSVQPLPAADLEGSTEQACGPGFPPAYKLPRRIGRAGPCVPSDRVAAADAGRHARASAVGTAVAGALTAGGYALRLRHQCHDCASFYHGGQDAQPGAHVASCPILAASSEELLFGPTGGLMPHVPNVALHPCSPQDRPRALHRLRSQSATRTSGPSCNALRRLRRTLSLPGSAAASTTSENSSPARRALASAKEGPPWQSASVHHAGPFEVHWCDLATSDTSSEEGKACANAGFFAPVAVPDRDGHIRHLAASEGDGLPLSGSLDGSGHDEIENQIVQHVLARPCEDSTERGHGIAGTCQVQGSSKLRRQEEMTLGMLAEMPLACFGEVSGTLNC
jgi:hypothetical protein